MERWSSGVDSSYRPAVIAARQGNRDLFSGSQTQFGNQRKKSALIWRRCAYSRLRRGSSYQWNLGEDALAGRDSIEPRRRVKPRSTEIDHWAGRWAFAGSYFVVKFWHPL